MVYLVKLILIVFRFKNFFMESQMNNTANLLMKLFIIKTNILSMLGLNKPKKVQHSLLLLKINMNKSFQCISNIVKNSQHFSFKALTIFKA